MRYIGGKALMLDNIKKVIDENTKEVKIVTDLFSGSGTVATFFKKNGNKVISNDTLYFSYVLNAGTICLNKEPEFKKLRIKEPISYLNNLSIETSKINIEDCFIYNNYSPNEKCERMYFQNENAKKIDIIRITIENWAREGLINNDEYFYLLASLISAVPYISNIAGVYGAYLKNWDIRTYNKLTLKKPELIKSKKKHLAYNSDSNNLIKSIKSDLIYIDPPYNGRQYLPNYHVLETIARYDSPEIKGVTGMRDYALVKSDYCQKSKVKNAFDDLIKNIKSKYVLISYNTEGLLSTEELSEVLKKYAKKDTFKLYEYNYRRYKNKIPNNTTGLKEQLYFFEKG